MNSRPRSSGWLKLAATIGPSGRASTMPMAGYCLAVTLPCTIISEFGGMVTSRITCTELTSNLPWRSVQTSSRFPIRRIGRPNSMAHWLAVRNGIPKMTSSLIWLMTKASSAFASLSCMFALNTP